MEFVNQQSLEIRKTRMAVKLPAAETYIFISLTAFGLTVVVTRVFLQLAGYPQLGNSVLHIAHALWGGLLLFAAGLTTLILANRWAFTTSAVLSGIGVGLFIDEVGKFITQKNDYFYAPAAPLIYSAFLLMTLAFLLLRRSRQTSPRSSMYRVLLGLREVLDNDLDPKERDRLLGDLANGRNSTEPHIALFAEYLAAFLLDSSIPLVTNHPGFWPRFNQQIRSIGDKLGRKNHRRIIMAVLTVLGVNTLIIVSLLAWAWMTPTLADEILGTMLLLETELTIQAPIWLVVRLVLQLLVGILYLLALFRLVQRREEMGLNLAILAALLSLTAVHLLTFYLNQFGSLSALFIDLFVFLLLFTYRSWYLSPGQGALKTIP